MATVHFHIDQQTVTCSVNWLGFVTIRVNGETKSKKLSFPWSKHTFDLLIDGQSQPFQITSTFNFSGSQLTIKLYHHGVCMDSKTVDTLVEHCDIPKEKETNMSLAIGILFIVLTLCFDWSRFFLFFGLYFLFQAFHKPKTSSSDCKSADIKQLNE
ncbi:hypothetical protein ACU8DI_10705 [Psychroserpens sp. BH13MA-6]